MQQHKLVKSRVITPGQVSILTVPSVCFLEGWFPTRPETCSPCFMWGLSPIVLWDRSEVFPKAESLWATLTWAAVIRVSVHTVQEGHPRKSWLPSTSLGRHQTTVRTKRKSRALGKNRLPLNTQPNKWTPLSIYGHLFIKILENYCTGASLMWKEHRILEQNVSSGAGMLDVVPAFPWVMRGALYKPHY